MNEDYNKELEDVVANDMAYTFSRNMMLMEMGTLERG